MFEVELPVGLYDVTADDSRDHLFDATEVFSNYIISVLTMDLAPFVGSNGNCLRCSYLNNSRI